jgi:E3 ubiquitin-protein ligase HUWE1
MVFDQAVTEEAMKVTNSILRLLQPLAMEEKRQRDKADVGIRAAEEEKLRQERRQNEGLECKESEEKERKERSPCFTSIHFSGRSRRPMASLPSCCRVKI